MEQKPKLFIDMDGVLAEWKTIKVPTQIPTHAIKDFIYDRLYQKNYYYDLKANKNVIDAVKTIIENDAADVYILSCVLPQNDEYPDSFPQEDKRRWLHKYFGNLIPDEHFLFVPDAEPKISSLIAFYGMYPSCNDLLLDDYTLNLIDWVGHKDKDGQHLSAIKYMNDINGTKGIWLGDKVYGHDSAQKISQDIMELFPKERQDELEL